MVEFILGMFAGEEKVQAVLANPLIEFIFMVLFIAFILAVFVHIFLFTRLRSIRNYLKDTNRMDIAPLSAMKDEFEREQEANGMKVETFVQEKFSGWRVFQVPAISLMKMVQMTVSVFILLGVLGTFIGLTMSLGSINMTGGDQLVEDVAAVLAGIDVAFYTSIAGMGFSLFMTILIRLLNTEFMLTDIMLMTESALEREEKNGVNRLIEVTETINQSILGLQETNQESLQSIEKAFHGFQEYTTGLQQSAKDLALFNEGLHENLQEFQELFQQMRAVTDGFEEGTSKLNKNFDSLFSYFKKMDSRNERMTKAFEQTYEKVNETSAAQLKTLGHFEESVDDVKNFTSSLLEEQQSMQQAFEKIEQKTTALADQMGEHNKEFKKIFGDDVTGKLTGMNTYLRELSADFDEMGSSLSKLPDALDVINQTQAEYKHLLSDRFQELKEFNRTFNDHLQSHAQDSRSFERNMQEATRSYEQIGMKNSELIQEINATIAQMGNSFNQRENQLEASVGVLRDTLSNYVSNLEGNVGHKLDQLGRTMTDYMQQMNEGLRSEFMELNRVTETNQQSNARFIQQTLQELNREIQMLNQQRNGIIQQPAPRNNRIGMNQNEY
ncbi:MotA/TolQ/ExbB proton channel family protein [Virgibacillus kimchii]